VGDGNSTIFSIDPLLDGRPLMVRFNRSYVSYDYKLVLVEDMFTMGWGMNGEAWKWRR